MKSGEDLEGNMMIADKISNLLLKGEGLGIEFKRCSGAIEHDVFETVCAFLNRFGGDILLGVENDGTYGGADPVFQDGDMFTISVSLEKIKDLMSGASAGAEVAQKRVQVAQKHNGKDRTDTIERSQYIFG